jgi:hypothetical protein
MLRTGLARKEIRLYNAYASTIPVGHPCLVRYDGDEETNPFVVSGASASGTAVIEILLCAADRGSGFLVGLVLHRWELPGVDGGHHGHCQG